MLWHTATGAIAAPFSPVFLGAEHVPEEYRMHRYLTSGESARVSDNRFVDRGEHDTVSHTPQGVESTRSAVAVFKRLMYLTLQHQDPFLTEAIATWEAMEVRRIPRADDATRIAAALLNAGEADLAARFLTRETAAGLNEALEVAEALAASIEARTRARWGISDDPKPKAAEQLW